MEDMKRRNVLLEKEEVGNKFIKFLHTIGSAHPKQNIIMKAFMKTRLAMSCSWLGLRNNIKASVLLSIKIAQIKNLWYQELVVTSSNERNWRGIFIALLVIVAVLGLILFSIVLVSPLEEGPRNRGTKPTLEDIILRLPEPAKFNGTWISDIPAHTQNVERLWRDIRFDIPRFGRRSEHFPFYLAEHYFHRQFPEFQDRYHQFFKYVAEVYPPIDTQHEGEGTSSSV